MWIHHGGTEAGRRVCSSVFSSGKPLRGFGTGRGAARRWDESRAKSTASCTKSAQHLSWRGDFWGQVHGAFFLMLNFFPEKARAGFFMYLERLTLATPNPFLSHLQRSTAACHARSHVRWRFPALSPPCDAPRSRREAAGDTVSPMPPLGRRVSDVPRRPRFDPPSCQSFNVVGPSPFDVVFPLFHHLPIRYGFEIVVEDVYREPA